MTTEGQTPVGGSVLVQGLLDEGDGGQLLAELLQDNDCSEQGEVFQPKGQGHRTMKHP